MMLFTLTANKFCQSRFCDNCSLKLKSPRFSPVKASTVCSETNKVERDLFVFIIIYILPLKIFILRLERNCRYL